MSRHGTQARYVDGCRCAECRHAHALRARRYRHAKGPTGYVPVERVLPLVEFLVREYGSLVAAERAAGFTTHGSRFSSWTSGRATRVHVQSAVRLAEFVKGHQRRTPLEPWATFDTDRPRPATPWERERAEKYATDDLHARDRAHTRRKRERDRARA